MVRLSLHRHVPLLMATGALALACGPLVLGVEETDSSSDSDSAGPTDTTDSSPNPSSPSTSDPSVPNPTNPNPTETDPGPTPLPGPPQLIDARVLDAFTVELFFSEPIADIGTIEPSKFRLSAAHSNTYYSESTSYVELGRWNGVEMCNEYCYGPEPEYCNEYCYTAPGPDVRVLSVTNSGYSDRVLLGLDNAITGGICRQLERRLENGAVTAALFLHYSNNGAGLTDLDGEALDAIAEHWALLTTQDYSYIQGVFPTMNPFIPIDCPF